MRLKKIKIWNREEDKMDPLIIKDIQPLFLHLDSVAITPSSYQQNRQKSWTLPGEGLIFPEIS